MPVGGWLAGGATIVHVGVVRTCHKTPGHGPAGCSKVAE